MAINTEILNQIGDIIIISEAEFDPIDEDHIKGEFPNYDLYYKIINGAIKARILVLVKKDTVNITRLTQIEPNETACMWFKIKTEDQNFTLAAWYRQWDHPLSVKHLYTDGIDGQVERLESMKLQVKKAKNISGNNIITGDTNIDMLEEKDQISASRICRTMPIYRDILEENGMHVMNKNQHGLGVIKKAS